MNEPEPTDDLRKLNVRIFTAVWGVTAAGLLTLSFNQPWLKEQRFDRIEYLMVTGLDFSPYDINHSSLPLLLALTAFLCPLAATRPSILTAASAALSAILASSIEVQLLIDMHPQHEPTSGLWSASLGLAIAVAIFAPRAWLGWRARPRTADRYPHVTPRPGRDPRR